MPNVVLILGSSLQPQTTSEQWVQMQTLPRAQCPARVWAGPLSLVHSSGLGPALGLGPGQRMALEDPTVPFAPASSRYARAGEGVGPPAANTLEAVWQMGQRHPVTAAGSSSPFASALNSHFRQGCGLPRGRNPGASPPGHVLARAVPAPSKMQAPLIICIFTRAWGEQLGAPLPGKASTHPTLPARPGHSPGTPHRWSNRQEAPSDEDQILTEVSSPQLVAVTAAFREPTAAPRRSPERERSSQHKVTWEGFSTCDPGSAADPQTSPATWGWNEPS